jgi:GTP-binding protein HflX
MFLLNFILFYCNVNCLINKHSSFPIVQTLLKTCNKVSPIFSTLDLHDQNILREDDLNQNRDLDLIITERAKRFYDPSFNKIDIETCILVCVELKSEKTQLSGNSFSVKESMAELCELVGTAGLKVAGFCVQRLDSINSKTYVGSGKIIEIMELINSTNAKTIIFDDDLTPRQQRNIEDAFQSSSNGEIDIKILDRTAIILEIFAQHAKSREGQLQVELAMLEYRLTRGPKATGGAGDRGCGFRGPGESYIETDKRVIKEKIILLKKDIALLTSQRELQRKSRSFFFI